MSILLSLNGDDGCALCARSVCAIIRTDANSCAGIRTMTDARSGRPRRLRRRSRAPAASARPRAARCLGLLAERGVRRLEARLGVRLLNRTTRSVTPTEAGEAAARTAVAGARRGRRRARRGEQLSRQSRRHAAPQRADRRRPRRPAAADRAASFAEHPGIILEVTADDSFIDVLPPASTPACAMTKGWSAT